MSILRARIRLLEKVPSEELVPRTLQGYVMKAKRRIIRRKAGGKNDEVEEVRGSS